ncbi:MAG: isoprenylcysteine carboxylmethyltransferase family protein [Actinomycetota bacterium]|nr:isoprenylcysteine carboxylmethyltransferase family protein [Actinomycetota bacterium]
MERYDYGLWPMVVANAAILAAFLLGFLRPTQRREWGGFGAVAAFLVALFTEMYGFPLTIYLLAALFGREPFPDPFAHESGNFIASLLGIADWSWLFMLAGGALIMAGLLVVSSGWRRVHAARRAGKLVTDGPYAVVRHPQYSGLLLMIVGALVQWPTLVTVVMAPVLAVTYVRLARREERALRQRFGSAYAQYEARTPPFLSRHLPASLGSNR